MIMEHKSRRIYLLFPTFSLWPCMRHLPICARLHPDLFGMLSHVTSEHCFLSWPHSSQLKHFIINYVLSSRPPKKQYLMARYVGKTCGTGHHGLHDCSCLLYLLGTWYDGALSLPIQNSLEYFMLWYNSRDIYCYILSRPDLRLWLRSRTCYSLLWIENPFLLYLQKLMRWPPSLLMLCYFMWCH